MNGGTLLVVAIIVMMIAVVFGNANRDDSGQTNTWPVTSPAGFHATVHLNAGPDGWWTMAVTHPNGSTQPIAARFHDSTPALIADPVTFWEGVQSVLVAQYDTAQQQRG